MKRSDAIVTIAMIIAKQAIKAGKHDVDLSWLSVGDLLDGIEKEIGMMPPKTEVIFEYYGCEDDEPETTTTYVNKWEDEDE